MCMQEIAAGQDVSGGIGSEKLRSVLGNYVSPQKILKQLKEALVLYYRNHFANPVIKFKAQKQVPFMRICFAASRKLYYKYQQLFPETIYKVPIAKRNGRFYGVKRPHSESEWL